MRIFSLFIIVSFFSSCSIGTSLIIGKGDSKEKAGLKLIRAIEDGYSIIDINVDTLYIYKTIKITRPITINGNGVTIFFDSNKGYDVFSFKNISQIVISGITFKPIKKEYLSGHQHRKYPLKFFNCINIKLSKLYFVKNVNTCIAIYDSQNINIVDCEFDDIGLPTSGKKYSYDAIYLDAYNSNTSDVEIRNCSFRNIGAGTIEGSSNDGDGVQVYSKNATIERLLIRDCIFENIGRRGIKLQVGDNVLVESNSFRRCKFGVGIAMEKSTNDIKIIGNSFEKGMRAIGLNSYKENPCTSKGIVITENKVKDMTDFLRTSGSSSISFGDISTNSIDSLKSFCISALMSNTTINNNTISNFEYNSDNKRKAAISLWDGSVSNVVSNNTFRTLNTKFRDIHFYRKTNANFTYGNESFINGERIKTNLSSSSSNNKLKR